MFINSIPQQKHEEQVKKLKKLTLLNQMKLENWMKLVELNVKEMKRKSEEMISWRRDKDEEKNM